MNKLIVLMVIVVSLSFSTCAFAQEIPALETMDEAFELLDAQTKRFLKSLEKNHICSVQAPTSEIREQCHRRFELIYKDHIQTNEKILAAIKKVLDQKKTSLNFPEVTN